MGGRDHLIPIRLGDFLHLVPEPLMIVATTRLRDRYHAIHPPIALAGKGS